MIRSSGRGSRRLTFLVLAAGTGFFAMLQSLITPVLPTIQHDLHTSPNTVTWVLTAYLLSASVFTPIVGRIGDMVGKEKTLVFSLAALAHTDDGSIRIDALHNADALVQVEENLAGALSLHDHDHDH